MSRFRVQSLHPTFSYLIKWKGKTIPIIKTSKSKLAHAYKLELRACKEALQVFLLLKGPSFEDVVARKQAFDQRINRFSAKTKGITLNMLVRLIEEESSNSKGDIYKLQKVPVV